MGSLLSICMGAIALALGQLPHFKTLAACPPPKKGVAFSDIDMLVEDQDQDDLLLARSPLRCSAPCCSARPSSRVTATLATTRSCARRRHSSRCTRRLTRSSASEASESSGDGDRARTSPVPCLFHGRNVGRQWNPHLTLSGSVLRPQQAGRHPPCCRRPSGGSRLRLLYLSVVHVVTDLQEK